MLRSAETNCQESWTLCRTWLDWKIWTPEQIELCVSPVGWDGGGGEEGPSRTLWEQEKGNKKGKKWTLCICKIDLTFVFVLLLFFDFYYSFVVFFLFLLSLLAILPPPTCSATHTCVSPSLLLVPPPLAPSRVCGSGWAALCVTTHWRLKGCNIY